MVSFANRWVRIKKITWYGFSYVVIGLLSLFPKFLLEPMVYALAATAYLLSSKKRRLALVQLQETFGATETEAGIKTILKNHFYHIILFSVEFFQIRRWSEEKIRSRVRVEGLENFQHAVDKNKGVILVTAHFGNFPLMAIAGSLLVGPVTFMMNPNLDPGLRSLIQKGMTRFGNRALFRGDAVDKIEKILDKKETICLLMDQQGKEEHLVEARFLGKRFRFNSGAAFLSLRFGAPVVPVYNYRHKDGTYEIRYGHPILDTNIDPVIRTLEASIREAPDHWLFWGWKGFAVDFATREERVELPSKGRTCQT